MRIHAIGIALLCGFSLVTSDRSLAEERQGDQTTDNQELSDDHPAATRILIAQSGSEQDRLDVIERELNQLQRQVYRNEVGGAPAPVPGSSEAPPASTPPASLDVQLRMDRIESDVRELRGQVEEVQYGITQINARLDKTQADNEVRFQQLESGPQSVAGLPTAQSGNPSKPARDTGDQTIPASATGFLTPPDSAAPSPSPPPASPPSPGLAGGSVTDQYKAAFALLGERDYKGAEAAFKVFLQKHPTDPLAANARYWLGETYFGREDYVTAASAFAEAYQRDPQGPKAPEDLLKLAISLGKQGRKTDACVSFARLDKTFPTMSASLKDRVSRERQHLGC